MKITIYTKSSCPNCVTAKQLLKAKGMQFEERDMDNPAERAAFCMIYPDVRQMPQVFIDGQRVGGLAGLQAALAQIERGTA